MRKIINSLIITMRRLSSIKKTIDTFVLILALSPVLFLFQSCGSPFQSSLVSTLSSSSQSLCTSGEIQTGYTASTARSPVLCGSPITKTCVNGAWDKNVNLFSNCIQQCVRADNQQVIEAGSNVTYITFSTSLANSQALCDAARVTSTCDAASDAFVPPPALNSTCLVAGQTCAYTMSAGTAQPSGNQTNDIVTGYVADLANYPTKCGASVTRTCNANGSWSGSVPIYTNCTQKCVHSSTGMQVVSGTTYTYNYFTLASGSQAACDASQVQLASSCGAATGLFAPTPPAGTFSTCSVVAAPTLANFSPSSTSVQLGQSLTLSWTASAGSTLRLDPGATNVTGMSSYTFKPTTTTPYTLTATTVTGSTSLTSSSIQVVANATEGAILYANKCSSCHGSINVSTRRNTTIDKLNTAIDANTGGMGQFKTVLSTEEKASIILALGQVIAPNVRATYICDPSQVPKTSILKLTNREYKGSVGLILDAFGTTLKTNAQLVTFFNNLPSDNLVELGHNVEQYKLLTSPMVSSYFDVAYQAGVLVAGSGAGLTNYPNTTSCLSAATITQACHQNFVKELTRQAFRRPLTATELTNIYSVLWDTSLSKTDLITATVASVLQMPDFIYRIYDSGTVSPKGASVLALSAHEYAEKISFLLTGLPPDAILKALADSGAILNATTAGQQVDRLLATPAAAETLKRFFKESMGYDIYDSFTYSSQFLNGINSATLKTAMTKEVDDYVADILQKQNGTFKDLMTSQRSTITDATLATIYEVAPGVTSLPVQRSGLLNRAAFLAKRSGNYTTPVKRGQNILENILCGTIPPPPADAPPVLEPSPTGVYLTTRQRYANKTEVAGSTCIICHSRMNNLGYPFEMFDSIGRFRTQERIFELSSGNQVTTLPILTSATTNELTAGSVSVIDAVALTAELANNDNAIMCLVKKWKVFESRRAVASADNCQMNKFLQVLYGTNGIQGPVFQGIKEFILSDDYKLWSY